MRSRETGAGRRKKLTKYYGEAGIIREKKEGAAEGDKEPFCRAAGEEREGGRTAGEEREGDRTAGEDREPGAGEPAHACEKGGEENIPETGEKKTGERESGGKHGNRGRREGKGKFFRTEAGDGKTGRTGRESGADPDGRRAKAQKTAGREVEKDREPEISESANGKAAGREDGDGKISAGKDGRSGKRTQSYAKTVLYIYPRLERIAADYGEHIRHRAIFSYENRTAERAAEYLAEEILKKRAIEALKERVDAALKKLNDEERFLLEVRYFGRKKKLREFLEAGTERPGSERSYYRKQERLLKKVISAFSGVGLTEEAFFREYRGFGWMMSACRQIGSGRECAAVRRERQTLTELGAVPVRLPFDGPIAASGGKESL